MCNALWTKNITQCIVDSRQGSGKVGRLGRIFPDKPKSHGHISPKTKYKTERDILLNILLNADRHTDKQICRQ